MTQKLTSKLLLVEGLPSTGKSTNSGILRSQLDWNGHSVRWVHEVARPHPTLFFNEACMTERQYRDFIAEYPHTKYILESIKIKRRNSIAVDLLDIEWNYLESFGEGAYSHLKRFDVWNFPLERYIEVALEKWEHFVECQLQSNEIAILDSSIFQFQIYTFILENAPYEKLYEFIQRLYQLIERLNPTLIYLYRKNVEDTIDYLVEDRGIQFLERIWERDKHLPYYRERTDGTGGYKSFLRDYDKYAGMLFEATPFRKISVEISDRTWDKYVHQILSELTIPYIEPPRMTAPTGTFFNEQLKQTIRISQGTLITPHGAVKRLVPKGGNEFFLHDLPTTVRFVHDTIVMAGEQICEQWTTHGTVFVRIGD